MRALLSAALVSCLAAGFLTTAIPASAAPAAPPVAQGSTFTSVSPVRVLDTRDGTGGVAGPVGPGRAVTLTLSARVPANATAVVLNVTAVGPTAPTFVTVYPSGQSRPLASNLNLAPGDTRPNLVTVALGAGRAVDLYNNAGNIHLVADLAGYYATGAGARYTAARPENRFDGNIDDSLFGPGGTRTVDLSSRVPASATAVALNVVASDATAPTFVTVWPAGTSRPAASNLSLDSGERANMVIVALGADRRVSLYNNAGNVHLDVFFTGFYTPEFGATFVPRSPTRVVDTRDGTGGKFGRLGADEAMNPYLDPVVPENTTALLLNVTGVDATGSTRVTVRTRDGQADYLKPTLSLRAGETAANLSAVALGTAEPLTAYNWQGSVHLVADLAGVFVAAGPACTTDCLYTWGPNQSWELGTGARVPSAPSATQVVGLSGVTAVAGVGSHRLALRSDGTVWGWGDNFFGGLGGDWHGDWSPVPAPVPGLTGVTGISGGQYHALALMGDGTVRGWGWLFDGPAPTDVPVPVAGLTGVTAIASSSNTAFAVRGDGTVWAWGTNTSGMLGTGSTEQGTAAPVQIPGLTGVIAIATNWQNAYALRADGTVWAWGLGDQGQLGAAFTCPGASCSSPVPVQVTGLSGITGLGADLATGYAVRADGTVAAWGSNEGGQLGNGTAGGHSATPVSVTGLSGVTELSGGAGAGYALRADGTVWAWGRGDRGQLGTGTSCTDPLVCRSTTPVRVVGLSGVTAIASGAAIVPNP